MKGQAGAFIGVFILVLVGITGFLPTIQNQINLATVLQTIENETHTSPLINGTQNLTFTLSASPFGAIDSITLVQNGTDASPTNITTFQAANDCLGLTLNYTINDATGQMVICNYNSTADINVTYVHQRPGFQTNSGVRTILNNVPLFVGIAILLGVLSLFAVGRRD